jgi:hypothetical protein
MESIRGDSVLLRELIPSLSDSAVAALTKKLDALTLQRTVKSKMSRQGTVKTMTAASVQASEDRGTYFSHLAENAQKTPKDDRYSLNVRQQTVLMLDNKAVDDIECLTSAAQKIQNVARGIRDRAVVDRKKEDLFNSRANAALTQGEFVPLAGDILRNTIFNLMQEAVFDEFPVLAEPIKFVVKKDNSMSQMGDEEGFEDSLGEW